MAPFTDDDVKGFEPWQHVLTVCLFRFNMPIELILNRTDVEQWAIRQHPDVRRIIADYVYDRMIDHVKSRRIAEAIS